MAAVVLAGVGAALPALAQETETVSEGIVFVTEREGSISQALFTANNIWMMLAAALVFIMHLGFACVESGLTQAKNTTNILFKNTLIPGIGILTYAVVGFNLMYPGDAWTIGGFLGTFKSISTADAVVDASYNVGYTYWTDFLFQAMFAATAATIVSGAVAERIKLHTFLIFSVIFVAISYPITGSWKWGYGWLDAMGFQDFAGSTLVHAVGGFAALAGAIVLGPRIGKFRDGKIHPIPGHSMPLATIGVFMLWLGWFGFNGGSVLSADPGPVSFVLVTTCLAASAGAVGAMLTAWIMLKKPDLSMALNGILAGLVGITAGANVIPPLSASIVGFLAGIIVVFSVIMFDKIKIDDPVGAISVHGVCGVFGTLCVAIFGVGLDEGIGTFSDQLIGTVAVSAWSFFFALILFLILKPIFGLRVSQEEEIEGLDIGEHGNEAYPDFQPATKG